jgi:hypothetical protein
VTTQSPHAAALRTRQVSQSTTTDSFMSTTLRTSTDSFVRKARSGVSQLTTQVTQLECCKALCQRRRLASLT